MSASAASSSPSALLRLHSATNRPPPRRRPFRLSSCHASIPISAPSPSLPVTPRPEHVAAPKLQSVRRREAFFALAAAAILSPLLDPDCRAAAENPECPLVVSPSGLAFCDQVLGTGPEAAKGQLIKAHYVGKLENGKVFDSSYSRGKPLTFRIGVGEVIKGWDQGILGGEGIPPMLAGGKRTLRLPAELGYGARGAGCRGGSCIIPPDSTLLFEVEFIGKA